MSTILFLVPHPEEDAGYRYRVQQFIPYLEDAGHHCTVWPFSTEALYSNLRLRGQISKKLLHGVYCTLRRIVQIAGVSRFDVVVIQREVFPFLAPLMENLVSFRNSKVVFSFDDAIYAGHDNAGELNHPILYRLKYTRGIERVIRRSMHVIVGNRILAEYARKLNPRVSVIPTVVDCSKYTCKPWHDNGTVTVGWIGSRSTAPYLRAVEPALIEVARANPGQVRFRFYGFPEYRPELPNADSLPFRLQTEMDDLHSLDIGLMPVPDTEWGRGKCAFKAIQYMACGIPAVASPVGITTDLIQHNMNGLLANSVEEWFSALNLLVRQADVRVGLSQAARQTIEASYSLQVWGPKFVTLFQTLLGAERLAGSQAAVTVNS